jgi:hypothetical protein
MKGGNKKMDNELMLDEREKMPYRLKKEMLELSRLGLEDYEIKYILYLKTKTTRASRKWR